MSEERYIIEMADDGFYSLTDNQTKFIFVEEDKSELERLKDYLIIKDKQLYQLKQQLAEKDKEIEMLKHTLNLYNLRHKGSVLPNVNQLAIQELEKVKMMTEWKFNSIVDVVEYIDNQIKELKGE